MNDSQINHIPSLSLNGVLLPELASVLSAPCRWSWRKPVTQGTADLFWKLSACGGVTRGIDSAVLLRCAKELLDRFHDERTFALKTAANWAVPNKIPWDAEVVVSNWEQSLQMMLQEGLKASICEFRGGTIERASSKEFPI